MLSGYVNAVVNKGLMYGMPDGYFHPEMNITYAEACTIMVKLLGYTDTDVSGVWPSNYINKASDLKLTDGLKFRKNDKVTVLAAAVMFDNLLDTNVKGTTTKFSDSIALYGDYIIMDDSITDTKLSSNAVLTDKGILYLQDSSAKLEVGNKYRLNVDNSNITKIYGKIRETVSVTIDSVIENTIYYKDGLVQKSMSIPSEPAYYSHGTKQAYSGLTSVLKPNTKIVFTYNEDKTGFEYAVIIDPVYSKPEVAVNFDTNNNSLGSIDFDASTPFMKNGQSISKYEIEDLDVVYSVTDINGSNRTIVVYNDRAEGKIKAMLPNGISPTTIQIEDKSYSFSKDMDLSKLSSFKVGDKVSALLGYDGKVVDIVKIDYKTANEKEVKIVGNSKTIDTLLENQVKTDIGTFYFLDSAANLEIGGKYKVIIDDTENTIVKIKKKENSLDNYSVRNVIDSTVYYGGGKEPASMVLPRIATYYYNGEKTDYATVLSNLKPSSSIVLAKVDGKYEYGVVADPIYSKPILNNYANKNIIDNLNEDNYLFIYRNGTYVNGKGWLEDSDVVYTVSDLWNINSYIYASNTKKRGRITNIAPNRISPTSITISISGTATTFTFNKDFDKTTIVSKDFDVDDYVGLILDKDGKVLDIN